MEIIILIVVGITLFICGAVSGWRAREAAAERTLNKFLEESEKHVKQEEKVMHISVEKHHEVFYAFEKNTDRFLGQGASKEELDSVLSKRFPGMRFGVTPENLNEIGWLCNESV